LLVNPPGLAKVVTMTVANDARRPTLSLKEFQPLLLVMLLTVGLVTQAYANSLFRWTDSEGRLHFGDRPPPVDAGNVEELSMPTFAAPSLPAEQDPYSILNQLGRLEANRRDLERERQERAWQRQEYYLRKRELEARERAAEAPSGDPVFRYLRPVYPRHPIHRPGRPGHRPGRPELQPPRRPPGFWEPDHPAYRPRPPVHLPRHPVVAPRVPGRGASVNLRR